MALESSMPKTTVAEPPTSPRTERGCSVCGASVPPELREMDASPPGACWNRGAGPGVSMSTACSALRWWNTSSEQAVPKTMVAGPPTGPRAVGTTSGVLWSSAREMEEKPPGACWKRGAASGVSRQVLRSSWCVRRLAVESSLPSRMEVGPPTGPLRPGAAPATSGADSLPPGACGKRGAASGVSTVAPRCSWRWERAAL
mmetsp:Transcript_28880/g.85931  ORF Transcript_28880/g.85931 Transcript_28880/m.85931 type:complete len:200 (-) Transcript_28880:1432-2031(-)